jgi:hypothetical protein
MTVRLFVAALMWNVYRQLLHRLLVFSVFLAAAATSLVGRLREGLQRCALSRTTALHVHLKLLSVALAVQPTFASLSELVFARRLNLRLEKGKGLAAVMII